MFETVSLLMNTQAVGPADTALRFGMLARIRRTCARQGVTWLAFGLGAEDVRLVFEGPEDAITQVIRGLKVGTSREARSWGLRTEWSRPARERLPESHLEAAVAWAHQGPEGEAPLASPWSSHRDLLGYRQAEFFDAGPLARRVDPDRVHRLAGGGALPTHTRRSESTSLAHLLRVAAAPLGCLPADRKTFPLFVQLAKARGWRTKDIAEALMLTTRRIRQLAAEVHPLLGLAQLHLSDPRLAVVP